MKNFYFLIFLFVPSLLCAQDVKFPIDSMSHKVSYQGIEYVSSVSKDELYIRAREWFARIFVSAQDVIQMDDKAAGKIIGKGVYKNLKTGIFVDNTTTIYYTVSITVKDGRYRYEISDIYREIFSQDFSNYTTTTGKESLDELINNPKNINKDGEYKGKLKQTTLIVNTVAPELRKSIIDALSKKATGYKSKDDF